ncbi:MAG: LysR family transcriptional regulator [Caulobacterales bacterium]|nr:LysR family transcriptional regulator [Caulobacterales bacterium]
MDRLGSMAVFVKAADLGSFTAAAEATGLSATMVGKHVQFLEGRLGVRLLNRTTRRQSLTEFGRAYYDRCRLILEEAEAADALASEHLNVPHGTLRITMPALLGRLCAAPLLYELALRTPSLRLDLHFDDHIVDLAADGFDLSIRTGEVADRVGLTMRRLGSHRMLVCAAPGYLAAHGAPGDLEALGGHRAVTYARSGWHAGWRFGDGAGGVLEVAPPAGMRLSDLAAVTDAAVAGAGLAWLPAWLARPHLASGALVEVLTAQPGYRFDNYAVWPQAHRLPLKVRVTLDLLAAALPGRLE